MQSATCKFRNRNKNYVHPRKQEFKYTRVEVLTSRLTRTPCAPDGVLQRNSIVTVIAIA